MATALGGLWLPAPAAGIETRGPYKVPDNWGIFRAAISTRGRFAGSRLPCNAAAGSAQSASQPARKAGVQSRNASPSSGRLPGIDDGPSAQGSEPLRKQQRRQQPQQQQQQQQQSKQQQHKAVYRTQQDSRSTETSSTTEPAITRQSRDTQSSGSRRNGSSNKSINPAARTLQASNAAGCAYSDDGSSLGGDGQRAGTSQDLRDLHEQSDTLKRRIAAARYGDGASSAEQLGADMEWQRHTCQVCDQLVKAGQWPTALDLLRRTAAVLPGVPIATRLLGLQLMRAAVRSGAGDAALHACVDVAPLQQEMLLVLLQHHRTARNLAGVRQVRAWLKRDEAQLGTPTRDTYFYLVLSHAQLGDLKGADSAFASMRAAGRWVFNDCAPVNVLLEAVHLNIESAFARFYKLQNVGFVGDVITFNTLLKACMRASDSARAEDVHAIMLEAGVVGDEVTYNTLIKALSYAAERAEPGHRSSMLSRAGSRGNDGSTHVRNLHKIRKMMEAAGYRPRGTVWGSLMTACGKAGQLGLAEALWGELGASGQPRTVEHYQSLMNACVWTFQGDKALAVFAEMEAAGLPQSTHSFNIAIAACASEPGTSLKIDRVYQALTLLNQMRVVGVKPDGITFNTLLHLCDRAEQGYCALSLYQDMQASGVKLDRIVANTLMSALGKSGLVDEVSAVFRRMVWGPARLRADRSTFLTVVRVFRECGALSPALHAYNGMRRAGFAPSNWEFQQLTVACAEAALRSGGAAERARAVALAGALPGEAIDLHGLSATEARVAVLCLLSSLQELHGRGQDLDHDLVIITGVGQHSDPEEGGPKLRATVERLLASLHLPICTSLHSYTNSLGPTSLTIEPRTRGAVSAPTSRTGSAFGGRVYAGLRAFKPPNLDAVELSRTAAVEGIESLTDSVVGGTAGEGAAQGFKAEAPSGKVEWSRGEAARLLTAAILLDWASPAGGGSWPASAGFQHSRVAETAARLGTEWLTAAAAEQLPWGGGPLVPSRSGVKPPAPPAAEGTVMEVGEVERVGFGGEVGSVVAERRRSQSRQRSGDQEADQRATAQHEEDCRNPGRLVVTRAALIAWLESRASSKSLPV